MNRSLLLLGRGYDKPAHFPRCDETWTTLACVNADKSITELENVRVWDCHGTENKYGVPVYDIRSDAGAWLEHTKIHGRTFANQYCWMLADLCTKPLQFRSVVLFGMRMTDREYMQEVQYMAYHLGYLRANGVAVAIVPPSQLLPPRVYGLEEKLSDTVDKVSNKSV